jgi:hypothetical protein
MEQNGRYLKYRLARGPLSVMACEAGCDPCKSPDRVRVFVSCNNVEKLSYV